ncbi:MAG: F0F1 ATP synthase subunit B [Gammaproteobacteria bacterium]|nr:F0F1 ATP synthase subunit B [Gammaproteobacteria bacterium]
MDFNATIIGQTIAMAFFVWFCMKYIWPPLTAALDERAAKIEEGLAAGEKAIAAQAEAEKTAEKFIDEARHQAQDIIDNANKRASSIVDEAKTDAIKERERQLTAAKSEIEQEINRAKSELRGQVSAIALSSAEKILQREIDASAHNELLNKLAAEI